ncbi:MAG: alpha-amylase family glycosyl hydrolase, partial [Bacteroidota bacterium]|nr:alpha-amylase family glycosyl hydrolase [Bacteroidota bacterium]
MTDGNKFSFNVLHRNKENKIWIVVPDGDAQHASDTLIHTLGYQPTSIIKPIATAKNVYVELRATTIENPYKSELKYLWVEDHRNPASSTILFKEDSVASVKIPSDPGTYYYNLLVVADQDSAWFQTMIRREENEILAYDIDNEDTPWMNEAILYQITPHVFVENGQYEDITAKLPELKELGINTLWLQPVFKSHRKGSQGYDVVDYFSLNPYLGSEEALRELITTAKNMNMRVLFDVVLNHSSLYHPYAIDRVKHGEASHYYDFYQYEDDGTPYSSFYNQDENGFINYFWPHLPNFNYDNEEVQRWMLEACKHWIREFDIDGYRLDAIWGVNARKPSFAKRLRTELKSIKPEVLLLAEAKGSDPEV